MMESMLIRTIIFASLAVLHIVGQCVDETTIASFDFVDKVEPTKSKLWTITYNGTYKVLTNLNVQTSYLLYQCGSEIPTGTGIEIAIEVPISSGFGVTQTSSLPFLSQLGQLDSGLKVYGNDPLYISDPCVLNSIASGTVAVLPNATSELPSTLADNLTMAFGFPFDTKSVFANSTIPVIFVSDFAESDHSATYEWIKFYSVFFNLEGKANSLFQEAEAQYTCTVDSVNSSAKTTVMWAFYSTLCGGWDVTYPCEAAGDSSDSEIYQYACDYATSCGLELAGATERSIVACDNRTFLSTDEFITFGKDIDVWIYPSPDWNSTIANYSTELSSFVSINSQKVFDTQAKGDNDWFEKRFARYFDVLSDFCTIDTAVNGKNGWFRNVFTDPIVISTTCSNQDGGVLTPFDYTCYAGTSTDSGVESDEPSAAPARATFVPSSNQKEVSDLPSLAPALSDFPSIVPSILPTDLSPFQEMNPSRDATLNTLFPTSNRDISNGVLQVSFNSFVVGCIGALVSVILIS